MISIYVIFTALATTALANAPLSKPAVSQMCLSAEQMKVSCSSEGDGVEFILTVDGLLLIKTRGHSQSQTNWTANMKSPAGSTIKQDKLSGSIITISLHGQMTGNVVCHVQNNFSRNETAFQLKNCKGSIECNFSEHTETLCSVAVGQLLLFHLPPIANTEIKLKKDNQYLILKVFKNQTETLNEEYVNQSQLFPNGTFKLGNAMKKHSGEYLLEEFRTDGILVKNATVHLEIQVPVAKPAVSQMCLSPEQMNISCSSEGDEVEFILTLDGHLLMQTRGHLQSPRSSTANTNSVAGSKTEQDKSGVSIFTISLHSGLTGNLKCLVWNNVSRDEAVIHLTDCKAFMSHFPVLVIRAVVVILLLLALCLSVWHVQKSVSEGTSKDCILYRAITYKM